MQSAMSCSTGIAPRRFSADAGLFRQYDVRCRDLSRIKQTTKRLTCVTAVSQTTAPERILRYPDGVVRRIRYPEISESVSPRSRSSSDGSALRARGKSQPRSPPSPQGDWHICSELDESCSFGADFDEEASLPGAAPVEVLWGAPAAPCRPSGGVRPREPVNPVEEFGELPSSPAALLEYLSSDTYAAERRRLQAKVDNSFEILHGCPWVLPRPLLTFAISKEAQQNQSMYTLPVAVDQEGTANELAKLLKTPKMASDLSMRQLKDGVIAFEAEDAASKFLDALQAAGSLTATMNLVDSHELFRMTASAQAVVVMVCQVADGQEGGSRGFVPTPSQLAPALRGNGVMDEW